MFEHNSNRRKDPQLRTEIEFNSDTKNLFKSTDENNSHISLNIQLRRFRFDSEWPKHHSN